MKLTKEQITVTTNDQGEVKSITFNDQEILHDGSQWWAKTYPMIWPNVSFSYGFEVEGKNYELPKHGFWKELTWQQIYEGDSISLLTTHQADSRYPFTIDIQQNVAIVKNQVIITTVFSNLSKATAYFHFGHHPAFKIDKDSVIAIDTNDEAHALDLQGKLTKDVVQQQKLMTMDFGVKYDTLVYKDATFNEMHFRAHGLNISVQSNDFSSWQVWKPKDAEFICIEPWQGWNDNEYDAPRAAQDKLDIVALNPGAVKKFEVVISIKK